MSKVLLVTSCKGGIGKSTVAANLSMALAMQGYRVLVVDCDFTMRSLDLIMGLEDRTVFSMLDVLRGKTTLDEALVKHDCANNLYFLTAPVRGRDEIDERGFESLFERIREGGQGAAHGFDYVVVDAPAADSDSVKLAARVSDESVIVCSHMPTAIRAAEQTSAILSEYNISKQRLLINSFDIDSALSLSRAGIIDMIDLSKLMLLGVVPYDRTLLISQENGKLIDSFKKNNNAKKAFENIAKRIDGKQVPLFDGFVGNKYKKLLAVRNA